MTKPTKRSSELSLAIFLFVVIAPGCEPAVPPYVDPTKPPPRVPTSGTVRLDGKPLAGALVTFLPVDQKGSITIGETKEDGTYELYYSRYPGGTAPGSYRVSVSYLQSPSGKVVSASQRDALVADPDVIHAKERLPKKYSDLGRTELAASVPAEGGTFDFNLDGPLLEPATLPEAPAQPASTEEPVKKDQAPAPATPIEPKVESKGEAPAPSAEPATPTPTEPGK